jgi:hypothetical protein
MKTNSSGSVLPILTYLCFSMSIAALIGLLVYNRKYQLNLNIPGSNLENLSIEQSQNCWFSLQCCRDYSEWTERKGYFLSFWTLQLKYRLSRTNLDKLYLVYIRPLLLTIL